MFRSLHKLCLQVALSAVVLAGCTSHSVPIPPPSPESVYFSLDLELGQASFRYDSAPAFAGATVYIFNRDAGEGIITTAESDGSVMETPPFPAIAGDEVSVTFQSEGHSSSTCVKMRQGQSDSSQECFP